MRRTRAPGAGNTRELRVMDMLAEEGWLCASRRHIGGAGDVLAIRSYVDIGSAKGEGIDARLIEVKSTAGGPWERFGPADRQALVETAEEHGAEAWLYWWPPRGKLQRIPASGWPISRVKTQAQIEGL
jgi:hypothetical protein